MDGDSTPHPSFGKLGLVVVGRSSVAAIDSWSFVSYWVFVVPERVFCNAFRLLRSFFFIRTVTTDQRSEVGTRPREHHAYQLVFMSADERWLSFRRIFIGKRIVTHMTESSLFLCLPQFCMKLQEFLFWGNIKRWLWASSKSLRTDSWLMIQARLYHCI